MKISVNTWILSIAVLAMIALSVFGPADELSERYVDDAFKRALVVAGLARVLNGAVSVAQETEISLTPAGVGVNLAPGEILDPINDLIERFSWIMLLASSALGVQKVLLEMSGWIGLSVILAGLGVLIIGLQWIQREWSEGLQNIGVRIFLVVLILRFMMPMISMTNEWVYRSFLQQQYENATGGLESAEKEISDINDEVTQTHQQKSEGLVERARELYENMIQQMDIDARMKNYMANAETISENTIRLIVVFLMQTVVFPLLFIWLLVSILRRCVRF